MAAQLAADNRGHFFVRDWQLYFLDSFATGICFSRKEQPSLCVKSKVTNLPLHNHSF